MGHVESKTYLGKEAQGSGEHSNLPLRRKARPKIGGCGSKLHTRALKRMWPPRGGEQVRRVLGQIPVRHRNACSRHRKKAGRRKTFQKERMRGVLPGRRWWSIVLSTAQRYTRETKNRKMFTRLRNEVIIGELNEIKVDSIEEARGKARLQWAEKQKQ